MVKRHPEGENSIKFGDTASVDAFGRLRVSDPFTLHESQLNFNLQPLIWNDDLTGGGSITHLSNESSAKMEVTTASGDKVIRQTKSYYRYQAGKSQLIEMTGVLGIKKAGVVSRMGYFDDDNGLFFEQDENNLKIVRRTKTSGSVVDNTVNQSEWNLDKMNGDEPSRVTIDVSKVQIYVIDFQWLGSGRIRFGFAIDGVVYYCHEELMANNISNVYMSFPNLPVRYEIENVATTVSNTELKQICSTVVSEGGFENGHLRFNVSNETTGVSVGNTAHTAVLAIRPKLLFNSIVNRGLVIPESFSVVAVGNNCHFDLQQGTILGGTPVWNSVDDDSLVEYSVNNAITTQGRAIAGGYALSGQAQQGASVQEEVNSRHPLTLNFDGTDSEVLSLSVVSFTGTATVYGSISWKEIY